MKNLILLAAIAVVLLSACQRLSENQKKAAIIQKVSEMEIDSCQYSMHGDIFYFADGDTVVKSDWFALIVYGENIQITERPEVVEEVQSILIEKWPTPEAYSSVSLRHFKRMIETTPLDSSFIKKRESDDLYTFYLESYKIKIYVDQVVKFESKGEIFTHTVDIYGEYVYEFSSSDLTKWTQEEQHEILQLLLSKVGNEDTVSYETRARSNAYLMEQKYWNDVKEEIVDGVYEKLNE